jgi:hypothetical protein
MPEYDIVAKPGQKPDVRKIEGANTIYYKLGHQRYY